MAEAVEKAEVILVCLSQKYKESPNCRTEAEYAYKLGKTLIPLRVETMYEPDGWLGALQAAKLYYDFSNMVSFESMFSKLTREIGDRGKCTNVDNIDGPISPVTASPVFARGISSPPPVVVNPVENWSKREIEEWAAKNQINSRKVTNLDGESLIFLNVLKMTAPEFFYKYASEKLGIQDLRDLMTLSRGLEELRV